MTAPTVSVERKSLRELRESSGTLFAKNNTPHKITCNGDKLRFELEPAGQDDSIRIVPKECLNEPGFQRLWMRKAVTLSDDPAMEDEITLLMGGHVEVPIKPVAVMGKDGVMQELVPTIEEPGHKRDITMGVDDLGQPITKKCIIGGEQIFQSQRQLDAGEPPLCPVHQAESHRVVSTPRPDGSWSHQLVT